MAWYHRLGNVFRHARVDRDLDRELRFHIIERADELRAEGMSEDEAMRNAQAQFGNFTLQRERTRDMVISRWIDTTLRNLRYALRTLAKSPGFTATVVLTLALGIGANSAVFSAIDAVLLRPLPFPEGDQLVSVEQSSPKLPVPFLAPVRLEEWNRSNSTLQAITGYYVQDDSEISGELPERLRRALVAPRFLKVWGIAPELGRDFSPAEEHFGGPNALLISHRLWQRRFGGDRNVIGKRLRFGQWSNTIVGVMPASFLFPDHDVDLWSSSPPDAPFAQSREATWFTAIGRLKSGVTVTQARENLSAVQAALGKQFPKTDANIAVSVKPLKETTVGGVRRSLWILFGSVSLLLLIACTNIASLLLSRATQRRQEIAVRFSLGASRRAIVLQLLTEVLVLAVAGAGLGLMVAAGASSVFGGIAKSLPRVEEIHLDWRIVLYSLACAVAATLLCGLFPAIRGTRKSLSGSLLHANRTQVSSRNRVQLALVGVQVALAVTLLAGAGLMFRSFQELGRVSPGFTVSHVLTFQISSNWGETSDWKAAQHRVGRILDSLRAVPGIEAATISPTLPGLRTQYGSELKILEGRAESEPKVIAENRFVPPSYFATMKIPLIAGELCREGFNSTNVVVNRSFANAYMPGSSPIGLHLKSQNPLNPAPGEIRGVAGDAREQGMNREPVPTVYWCLTAAQPGIYYLVRTHGEPMYMAEPLRRKIHEIEPQRSAYGFTPLEEHLSDAFSEDRLRTVLLSAFAITAVSLACVGLYGMLSYFVSVRRREVGLRLALGAVRGQIRMQFLVQGLGVSLLGCIAGLALVMACAKVLAGMLYGVSPSDPATLAGVVAIVLVVAAAASLVPASIAARLEPMEVLRDE
jgi:putative ABC transport system permease protein